eukprot:TRINITY_DN67442_c0_g1_i1.p1 TRINITY_DN67442_c0_g1~~TRINITY_DN67442_c0_g1_i1.p1  ORF type:complete len:317 (+),score=61.35 TRINITY_DN67442_c0_g1_i1:150-1100(+)
MKWLNWLCCFVQREGRHVDNIHVRKFPPLSTSLEIVGEDAEGVEAAFARKDMQTIVNFLDSSQAVECSDKLHPWAENPRTVGALAAARLAMLAQDDVGAENQLERARTSGAIPKLMSHLKSGKSDRVHHAIMALNMLVESHANGIEAYNAGALVFLLALVDGRPRATTDAESPCENLVVPSEMRALVSTTLLTICMQEEAIRRKFMELDGFAVLARQLSSVPEAAPRKADVLLEIVLNILDMIEPDRMPSVATSTLNDECAAAFSRAGGENELLALLTFADGDLQSTVKELSALLVGKVGNTAEIRPSATPPRCDP